VKITNVSTAFIAGNFPWVLVKVETDGGVSNVASPIGTVAGAHVCASMNNFLVMEFHAQDVAWRDGLVVGGHVIVDGFIHLDDKPGHDLTLNEDVARQHLQKGSSSFGENPWA